MTSDEASMHGMASVLCEFESKTDQGSLDRPNSQGLWNFAIHTSQLDWKLFSIPSDGKMLAKKVDF